MSAWKSTFLLVVTAMLLTQFSGCGEDRFARWDKNDDGKVVSTEVPEEEKAVFRQIAKTAGDTDRELTREEYNAGDKSWPPYLIVVVLLGVTVLPYFAGVKIADSLRLSDYGWKLGLILAALVASLVIVTLRWPPRTGIDLSGGVILIYNVDEEEEIEADDPDAQGQPDRVSMSGLVEALNRRLNPGGVSEIQVSKYGDRQVQVIIPKSYQDELDYIKDQITKAGVLKFRILAEPGEDKHDVARRAAMKVSPDVDTVRAPSSGDEMGRELAFWVELDEDANIDRDASVVRPATRDRGEQILVMNDPYNVVGDDLASVSAGNDEVGRPAVLFHLDASGARRFRLLTGQNLKKRLGIILDDELITAPVLQSEIGDSGQITGNFTRKEVEGLVGILRSGSLPQALEEQPEYEWPSSSLLGRDMIRSGTIAIGTSLAIVLVFMILYYRFAGVVACFALLANLLFIVAAMIIVRGAFTLPGLAGLVLTVGMSVDANVLIFERIREELKRGAALRMAIRNGFGKATTTIVDANLTTLITAIVLYAIGTVEIRGFAVTLILGILMSMFTAIFCARVFFDIWEKKRWLKKLSMGEIKLGQGIDFMGRRAIAAVASVVLIAVGLGGVFQRGSEGILDIDFLGGSSVVVTLKEPMPIGEVRDIVTDKWEKAKVNEVQLPTQRLLEPSELETIRKNPEKIKELLTEAELADTEMADAVEQFLADPKHSMYLFEPSTMYRVVVLNPELPDVQNSLAAAFVKGNESLLVDDSVVIGQVGKYQPEEGEKKEEEPKPQPQAGGAAPAGEKPSGDKPSSDESGGDKPAGDKPASGPSDGAALPHYGDPQFVNLLGDPTGDAPAGDAPTGDAPTGDAPTGGEPADGEAPAAGDKPSPPVPEEDGDTAPKVEPPKTEPPETGTPTTGPPATEPPRTEPPATEPPSRGPAPKDGEEGDDTGDKDGTIGVTQLQLSAPVTFKKPIRQSAVKELFRDTAEELDLEMGVIAVEPTDPTASTKRSLRDWTLHSSLDQESFDALLSAVRKEVESKPFWQMSGKIGGKEAGLMQSRATAALIVCLIGIIGYIWVRFQQVIFGLAAVVALVHDVLITLGALALSYWLAGPLGFLMIEEFKISLPVVAAFLTIIGYSLNDTIVVFDRIREVRGRSPVITKEIINTSINQTLGRTLLTSFTTLIVVLLLYVLGGQAIHTFAFCLLIGVVVGTYSSIFVASPVLLWMAGNKTSQSAGQNA